jgi:hypothetical protein
MPNYLPQTDSGLLAFGVNFASLITAAPAQYGLVAGDATTINSAVNAYDAALTAAVDPSTRTPVTIAAKNQARAFMVETIRPYAMAIKANAAVSLPDKVSLGLNYPNNPPAPVPAPTTAPVLAVIGATFGVHTLRFADENSPASRGHKGVT